MKGFEPEEVAICDWSEGFTVPLHTKRPAESFQLLVKIAFALDTPGNVRALKVHLQKAVDLVMLRSTNLRLRRDCT